MSTSKMIALKSSDGETFEVEESVTMQAQIIKHMIEDNNADTVIPLPKVTSKILAKVVEYCKRHVDAPKSEDKAAEKELKSFDAEFVNVDGRTLLHLILAAHYLQIQSLFDLTLQALADMIKGKNRDEIPNIFGMKTDFTPEEGEEVRRNNALKFE